MIFPNDKIIPAAGEESVWDYPRPPRVESVDSRLRVCFAGVTIAETHAGFRVLETSHPPVYYFPPTDVRRDLLRPEQGESYCEFKGVARYWRLQLGGAISARAAWSYANPRSGYAMLKDYIAFYPSRVESCWLGEEQVRPQSGDFYGGWITSGIVGPFKGGPGTQGW